jgi:ATP-dependent Clp protease adaptor protein ClpS
MTEELTQIEIAKEQGSLTLDEVLDDHKLIVHNDEVNTFDWVIQALVEICKHTEQQAEQCSLLIHYKGKYPVKTGSMKDLRPLKEGLTDRNIQATID